jgi:hypothetical protein
VDDINGGVTEFSSAGIVNLTPFLGGTPSKTTSLAFPGMPDANATMVLDINDLGDVVVAFIVEGMVTGPFDLGPNALG